MTDSMHADLSESVQATVAALGLRVEHSPELGRREAFELTHKRAFALVLAGGVDVFLIEAGQPVYDGARHYLASLRPGCLCCALPAPLDGSAWPVRLLAVPRQGTRLAALPATTVTSSGADPLAARALGNAVDAMLCALAGASWLPQPPSDARFVDPGQTTLDAGALVANSPNQVLWCATSTARCRPLDQPALQSLTSTGFPVTGRLWLKFEQGGDCRAETSAAVIERGALESALDGFFTWLLAAGAHALDAQIAAESARLAQSEAGRGRAVEASLWTLASLLVPRRQREATPAREPLINAIWLLADACGCERPDEERLTPALKSVDPVATLAQRAGLFARTVELEGRWWRDPQDPLLVSLNADGGHRLLLPGRGRRYDAIDPTSGERTPVTAALAARFASSARVFARPFPPGPLKAPMVLRFGLQGLGRDAGLVVLLILLGGLLSLAMPTLSQKIFDPIVPLAETDQLLVVVLAILIAGWARHGFGLLQGLYLLRIEGRMTTAVQTAVWDRLLKLPASFFHGFAAGDLANRAMSVDAMRKVLSDVALSGVTHGIIALFSLGLLFYYDWRVTLAVLVAVLIYGGIAVFAGRRVMVKNREILQREGQLQGMVLRLLDGLTKLRVAGAESGAFARWAEDYGQLQRVSFDQQRLENLLAVFKSGFSQFAMVAVIIAISWQGHEILAFYQTPENWAQLDSRQLQAVMPTSRFVAFHVALGQFLGGVFGLIAILVRLSILPAYYERVEPILSQATEHSAGALDPGEIEGDIAIEDVVFRYTPEGPKVLDGVSLRAAPRELIAVVGPSGAGKSSLVRVLLGFEAPESGSVFLDGQDIQTLDKHAMRRAFGVVLQSGTLLSGSIYQNIAGGTALSRDQVMDAVHLAGLAEDIAALPMGLDTHVSEGATTFSGGQRQRLMIARALVHRPRVLIFDEATSALDNRSQQLVTQGVETLNCTRILIAHRLSTIMHADRIYVLDHGRLVEQGGYQELLEHNGLFAAMARRQQL